MTTPHQYTPQEIATMADTFEGFAQQGQHPGRENMRHVAAALRQSLIKVAALEAQVEQKRGLSL